MIEILSIIIRSRITTRNRVIDVKRDMGGGCIFHGEEGDVLKENVDEVFRGIAALKISIIQDCRRDWREYVRFVEK